LLACLYRSLFVMWAAVCILIIFFFCPLLFPRSRNSAVLPRLGRQAAVVGGDGAKGARDRAERDPSLLADIS